MTGVPFCCIIKVTECEKGDSMKKKLVAYFSATGVTAGLAKNLAEAAGADLYEIVPEEKYTRADLDWTNVESRSSKEHGDRAIRPAISGKVDGMEQYETVFVGFPIWWYTAPNIILTFLESYDFTGKTIVPFATSGGSGIGKTALDLKASAENADIREGKRFLAKEPVEALRKWASDY